MVETMGAKPRTGTHLRLVALDHLNHLMSGAATDRDAADFLAWRRASRAHEHALRDALRLQRLVRIVAGWSLSDAALSNVVPIGTRR